MKIDMLRARSVTALVIALVLCAWLGISNHCALAAAVSERTTSGVECCPFHSHSAGPQKQKAPAAQPCCKVLRALVAPSAKIPSRSVIELPHLDLSLADSIIVGSPKIPTGQTALDTGPPGTFSFAELILQRSILSHAPPFLA
jgi:hypothetical protein